MKRFISALITSTIIISLFSGCGSRPAETGDNVYRNADNWLALPDELYHEADVIYLYPTTYMPQSPKSPIVALLSDEGMRAGAQNVFQTQATVFDTVADIYAPFYTQVNFAAFEGTYDELMELERTAARDSIFLALDYYFENHNNGRPYFLAGHSQGSAMLKSVLDEYMKEQPERYKNMIAAYMLGDAPTKEWLAANPHIKFAQAADDVGVLISWNSEGAANIGEYNMVVPQGAVAINPLNWRTDETYAGTDENKGSLLPDSNGAWSVSKGIADAKLDITRGSVIVESVDPAVYAIPAEASVFFGPESYHGWDYEFFYINIRENAALRLNQYLR